MSPYPETTRAAIDWIAIGGKFLGYFFAFVGGIVSATWVIAKKVSAYDARIEALEKDAKEDRAAIGNSLTRLHERIDKILLGRQGDDYRHKEREGDHE